MKALPKCWKSMWFVYPCRQGCIFHSYILFSIFSYICWSWLFTVLF